MNTKRLGILILILAVATPVFSAESSSPSYSKRESGLYQDVFDQNIYYEGTQYLHLERLYRDLFGKKKRSLNINAFDEVPDSTFFTNRHGRERMPASDLKKGSSVTEGPDLGGKWLVTKGKFEGITPGFFIRDDSGERYLLKFDPMDYPELATGAEIVTSRFMHALGYNIPQYTVVDFHKDQLAIEEGAKVYDESGFRRKLTQDGLDEFLLFIPEAKDGTYRASASRILKGTILGPMEFHGRRRDDPDDPVNHKDRREIRALQVFSGWLNNSDVRESNTLDVVETKEGRFQISHYLIDFNSSLGATPRGAKPPQFGHEHMVDYGEIFKAIFGLGLWKKPWQRRWEAAGEEVSNPSAGYFDNRYFKPARYKTQLPYYSFKDLTRSDGFWAAKLIMRFSDEEIREIVSTGEYSDSKTLEELANVLIERRDVIGRFWFSEACPLDEFKLAETAEGSYALEFEDLAVRYGFEPKDSRLYRLNVIGKKDKSGRHLEKVEVKDPSFSIRPEWLQQYPALDLLIQSDHAPEKGKKEWSPFVRIEIRAKDGRPYLAGIFHQD